MCSKFMLKFPRCGCNGVQVSKVFHVCVHGAQVFSVFQVHDPNNSWFGFWCFQCSSLLICALGCWIGNFLTIHLQVPKFMIFMCGCVPSCQTNNESTIMSYSRKLNNNINLNKTCNKLSVNNNSNWTCNKSNGNNNSNRTWSKV